MSQIKPDESMIRYYLESYNGVGYINTNVSHILRFWEDNKTELFKLFGEKLIISKQIKYVESYSEIEEKINRLWNDSGSIFRIVISKYDQFMYNPPSPELSYIVWKLRKLSSFSALAKNKVENIYNNCIKIEQENGKTITIQNGMKLIKAWAKLNETYHFCTDEEFEEFRIAHSQLLNQKKLSGNLTLSIHPLDYMTMSDNDCGWSSCMSWREEGCYRMGTVEMMNSPYVIVAYLTSDTDYHFGGGYTWNSKKWRQLFIVNKELIASVKAYPYQNTILTEEVIKFIAELAKNNWGINYHTEKLLGYRDSEYNFNFYTDYMYNDFGTTEHFIALANPDIKDYYLNYSGETECMCCGEIDVYFNKDDDGNFLLCEECDNRGYCEFCDGYLDKDEPYELDGQEVCSSCYYQCAIREFGTDEIHCIDNLNHYIVYLNTEEKRNIYCNDLEEYIEGVVHKKVIDERWWNYTEYFIYYDQIKPEWQDYFDDYDYTQV